MVLWDSSPPSSQSAGFPNKVTIPCPNNLSLDLLTCRAASSTSLESVTLRVVKIIKTESRMLVDTGQGKGRMGRFCLMGREFVLQDEQGHGDGCC